MNFLHFYTKCELIRLCCRTWCHNRCSSCQCNYTLDNTFYPWSWGRE